MMQNRKLFLIQNQSRKTKIEKLNSNISNFTQSLFRGVIRLAEQHSTYSEFIAYREKIIIKLYGMIDMAQVMSQSEVISEDEFKTLRITIENTIQKTKNITPSEHQIWKDH